MGRTFRNITAIAGRESRAYFGSPVAWVVMGFFALVFAFFFTNFLAYFIQQSMPNPMMGAPQPSNVNNDLIRPLLSNIGVLVLFLLPVITMRVFSEEKRSGTIELLLTSPLTDLEITLGKFFGALAAYLGLLAVTAIYVGILFLLGDPEWKPVIAGYLGLLLLGGSFISLGLFISSTTKNQVVAAGVTFVLALLFWIVNWAAESAGPTFGPILNYLSVTQHFEDFSKGVIDTKHLIFYLSFIAFGLFLTLKSVDTERWRG